MRLMQTTLAIPLSRTRTPRRRNYTAAANRRIPLRLHRRPDPARRLPVHEPSLAIRRLRGRRPPIIPPTILLRRNLLSTPLPRPVLRRRREREARRTIPRDLSEGTPRPRPHHSTFVLLTRERSTQTEAQRRGQRRRQHGPPRTPVTTRTLLPLSQEPRREPPRRASRPPEITTRHSGKVR